MSFVDQEVARGKPADAGSDDNDRFHGIHTEFHLILPSNFSIMTTVALLADGKLPDTKTAIPGLIVHCLGIFPGGHFAINGGGGVGVGRKATQKGRPAR